LNIIELKCKNVYINYREAEKYRKEPSVVAHTSNPSTQKFKIEVCEFEASLGYKVRHCLKKKKKPGTNGSCM
jgi:orotidine-5'-phosphate decarboxylase